MNHDTYTAYRLGQQQAARLDRENERLRQIGESQGRPPAAEPASSRLSARLRGSLASPLGTLRWHGTRSASLALLALLLLGAPASGAPASDPGSPCASSSTPLRPPALPRCF